MVPEPPKRLVWLVKSLDTLKRFSRAVQQRLGFALYQAQIGQRHESAKLLHGFEAAVWQVRADGPRGTYRAVYVVQLLDAAYVLHAFQKKAKSGIGTTQRDVEIIRQRLKLARRLTEKEGI